MFPMISDIAEFDQAKAIVERELTYLRQHGHSLPERIDIGTMEFALWAEAVENAGSFYPPDVIKSYEAGRKIQSTVGEVYSRKEDHQLVRPVVIVKGKQQKDMKNKEDYYEVVEVMPGEGLMQKPDAFGCNLGDYS